MQGHAAYDQSGQDIVCAAVSALAISCANGLEGCAGIPVKTVQRDGYLKVTLPKELTCSQAHDAALLLRVFRESIQSIQTEYAPYITIRNGGHSHD